MDRGVVADEGEFATLETKHPVSLRPAPVIADGHAHHPAEAGEHLEGVARLEVVALQMLEGPPRFVILVTGQVDLAVVAYYPAIPFDEYHRVVTVAVGSQLGIAEVKTHSEAGRLVEQGLSLGTGHLGLEEVVELGDVGRPPAGEEGGKRQFGEHDKITVRVGPPAEQDQEAFHHLGAGVVSLDGTHLSRADGQGTAHGVASELRSAWSRASRV